ncbi:MAG TPA: hypothetical protein PLN96_09910 [Zoogloea sp.]|uniref:DUF6691 family protein n=1 Tax=Zoogloea sp. TaxID=49181 RepID=UPI002C11EA77|nr:DUF6691 family protein [Zoogloea sp.]HMV17742.1 hypothetical protein [Rhodocyclaceae bacterium]HMV62201.1 hypothetical protein [Rhodocyclaceae bacterium]HMW51829.1 hypothetical protein [Rhodocyclaceae bacterium]HMY49962.1 hypothetical protein [Rhodocyclaceae bacterium]HMZ76151.1 hypothetical protein [Rhodocyclaceae bacterium]
MIVFTAFLAGLVFGIGLIVSGMANPSKVTGFLDLAGAWDPSLAFVMAGAIALGVVGYRVALRRGRPVFGAALQIPTLRNIDRRLVVGSALFGIGWGIAGICPGPGLVMLGAGLPEGLVFVSAMLVGMALFELQQGHLARLLAALGIARNS